VNWFSKQPAIALAFSYRWNTRPEGPWIAVGALGPFRNGPNSLRCDFSVTYFCFPPFKCLFKGHSSYWFRDPMNYRFIRWIPDFLPQFS
jgi:hypothetical protein